MACGVVLGGKNRINLAHTDCRFDSGNALGCEFFFFFFNLVTKRRGHTVATSVSFKLL